MTPVEYHLSQLALLEAEALHIMREVAAEFERPVLLFSGGNLDHSRYGVTVRDGRRVV